MELKYKVQHYDWGKVGKESLVAQLLASADPSVEIEENKPYAELWVGTHANGPALILERDVLLSEYLKDNEDAVGPDVKRTFGVKVPFLLKVLSIRKPLSIQVHPNKKQAEELHAQFPDVYTDDNHKPELAVALTPFEVLVGFRPLTEIRDHINKIPEFRKLLPAASIEPLTSWSGDGAEAEAEAAAEAAARCVRPVFEALMKADKAAVAHSLATYLQRVEIEGSGSGSGSGAPCPLGGVVRRLHAASGGEAGCWAPLLLNHRTLRPAEAVFLAPGTPHAYLAGDCVEVMANSDNVVRAGLTSKPVDVGTLLSLLDYRPRAAHALLVAPALADGNCCRWAPPVADFQLLRVAVAAGARYNTPAGLGPALALVTAGAGRLRDGPPLRAAAGTALFLKAGRQLTVEPDADARAGLTLYLATTNV